MFLVFVYVKETHDFFFAFGNNQFLVSWSGSPTSRICELKKYFEHVKYISIIASQFHFHQFATESFTA